MNKTKKATIVGAEMTSLTLTEPQRAALSRIALEPNGSMPLRWIRGRMVNAYRVARSLEEKGLVTLTNAGRDSADYLHITAKGHAALGSKG